MIIAHDTLATTIVLIYEWSCQNGRAIHTPLTAGIHIIYGLRYHELYVKKNSWSLNDFICFHCHLPLFVLGLKTRIHTHSGANHFTHHHTLYKIKYNMYIWLQIYLIDVT